MILKKSIYADLCLLIVAIIWGSGFIVTKNALDSFTPHYLNGIRFIISFLVLSTVFHKKMFKISKEELKAGVIIGLFLFGGFATQTVALQYTTASKSAFLTGTNVVIVPFLVWIVSRKFPGIKPLIGATLTMIGVGFLTFDGSLNSMSTGDILTLICAILFAAHICSIGHFASKVDPYVEATLQIGVTGIISLIIGIFTEPMPVFNSSAVPGILYLALVSTTLAFLIQNVAQRYTTSTHTAIILALESVFGTIFSVIFLNEILNKFMIIGCGIIFIAIIVTEVDFSQIINKKAIGVERL
jgi:drug/metabolite transporter (DMT)-like permease